MVNKPLVRPYFGGRGRFGGGGGPATNIDLFLAGKLLGMVKNYRDHFDSWDIGHINCCWILCMNDTPPKVFT